MLTAFMNLADRIGDTKLLLGIAEYLSMKSEVIYDSSEDENDEKAAQIYARAADMIEKFAHKLDR